MADYSSELGLKRMVALSPEEQAHSDAIEANPQVLAELERAIQQERDPAKRQVLMDYRNQQGAPAPSSGGLLDHLNAMGGGSAPTRGGSLLDALNAVPELPPAPEPSGMLRRAVGDTAVSAVKGAVSAVEAGIGLGDLVSGGHVGKALEGVGVRPKEAQSILDTYYSPEQQAANKAVQSADGVVDTLKAVAHNPSVVWHSAVQSLPSMIEGGVTGRALLVGAEKLAPSLVGRAGAAVAGGAAGEGITTMGSQAESIRQETPDGLMTGQQSALAAGSGAVTGLLGLLGGKIAQRMGIHDIDTLLVGKHSPEVTKGFTRRVIEGAVSEGLLEELPQSIQEQVAQNLALGKPPGEGVAQAAVLGALTGAAMGGGANVTHGGHIRNQKVAEPDGPVSRAVNNQLEAQAKVADVMAEPLAGAAAAVGPVPGESPPVAPQQPEVQPAAPVDMSVDNAPQAVDEPVQATPPAVEPEGVAVPSQVEEPAAAAAPESPAGQAPSPSVQGVEEPPAAAVPEVAPVTQAGAFEQRAADVPHVDVNTVQPGDILNPRQQPFLSMRAAMTAQAKAGGTEAADIVRVDGGLVVRPKQSQNLQTEVQSPAPDVQAAALTPPSAPTLPQPGAAQPSASMGSTIEAQPAGTRGTNAGDLGAFEPKTGTLGVPRGEMPQIKTEHHGALVNFLKARGITHEQVEVAPQDLKPTQAAFDPAKVREMLGGDPDARNILISADNHVLDGHHRWLAKMADGAEQVKAIRLDAPMSQLLAAAREFPSAELPAAAETPASAAPESAAPTTQGEGNGQEGQRRGQARLLTTAAPAVEQSTPAPTPESRWSTLPESGREATLVAAGWKADSPGTQAMKVKGWADMTPIQRNRITAVMDKPAPLTAEQMAERRKAAEDRAAAEAKAELAEAQKLEGSVAVRDGAVYLRVLSDMEGPTAPKFSKDVNVVARWPKLNQMVWEKREADVAAPYAKTLIERTRAAGKAVEERAASAEAPTAAEPPTPPARTEAVIALRKRMSILKSLKECLA